MRQQGRLQRQRLRHLRRRGHVLGHEAQGEAGSEAAREHLLRGLALGDRAAPGGCVDDLDQARRVEAEAAPHEHGLAGRRHGRGREVVVERLEGVPRAHAADLVDGAAQALQQGTGAGDVGGRAARHDGERAVRRAGHAAGDGRVHEGHAVRGQFAGQRARARRGGAAHVDEEAAASQSLGQPAERHLAHDAAVRQHGDGDVAGLAQRARFRRRRAVLRREGPCHVRARVVHGECVAGREQARHGPAHAPQPDEADAEARRLSHRRPPHRGAASSWPWGGACAWRCASRPPCARPRPRR